MIRINIGSCLLALSLLLSGCSGGGSSGSGIDPGPGLDDALNTMRSFKAQIATEAGAEAIALRGLQYAPLSELYIVDDKPDSKILLHRTLNVCSLLEEGECREQAPSDGLGGTYEFVWKRTFQSSANAELGFLEVAFKAAFEQREVESLEVSLQLHEPRVINLENPIEVLRKFYETLEPGEMIPATHMVSTIVVGRLRVAYQARDASNREIDLAASVLADRINFSGDISADYAEADGTRVVQESAENESIFAVDLFPVDAVYRDQKEIDRVLGRSSLGPDVDTEFRSALGREFGFDEPAVAEFVVRQQREPDAQFPDEDSVRWFLEVVNLTGETISFDYHLQIRNRNGFGFIDDFGNLERLRPRERRNLGSLLTNETYFLRFAFIPEVRIDDLR